MALQTGWKTTWLPFICFFYFFIYIFFEQLKRSVSFGCPLLQDYSLLNLLAAFSIILSYVSLPSCSLTSTPADRLREMETDRHSGRGRHGASRETGGQTDPLSLSEREKWPPEDWRLNITALNCQGCNISHFTKSLSTFWPFWYLTPRPIYCQRTFFQQREGS